MKSKPTNKSKKPALKPTGVRLNKYLSNAGICSRREADTFIELGMVQVNGATVTTMGFRVQPGDEVRYDGQRIGAQKKVYVLLNKPKGFVATHQGGKIKRSIQELLTQAAPHAVPAFGEMGRQATGLLFCTNDEDLRKKMQQSKKGIRMIYHIVLDKSFAKGDHSKLLEPQELYDSTYQLHKLTAIEDGKKNEVGVEAYSISPQLIVKLFAKHNYKVTQIDRVAFGGFTKKDLPRGNWRPLKENEVNFLRML